MFMIDKSNQAVKDYEKAKRFKWYARRMAEILIVLQRAPFEPTPGQGFERLSGNLKGYCSRQINHGNRILYKVFPNTVGARDKNGDLYEGTVFLYRAWGHNYKKPID